MTPQATHPNSDLWTIPRPPDHDRRCPKCQVLIPAHAAGHYVPPSVTMSQANTVLAKNPGFFMCGSTCNPLHIPTYRLDAPQSPEFTKNNDKPYSYFCDICDSTWMPAEGHRLDPDIKKCSGCGNPGHPFPPRATKPLGTQHLQPNKPWPEPPQTKTATDPFPDKPCEHCRGPKVTTQCPDCMILLCGHCEYNHSCTSKHATPTKPPTSSPESAAPPLAAPKWVSLKEFGGLMSGTFPTKAAEPLLGESIFTKKNLTPSEAMNKAMWKAGFYEARANPDKSAEQVIAEMKREEVKPPPPPPPAPVPVDVMGTGKVIGLEETVPQTPQEWERLRAMSGGIRYYLCRRCHAFEEVRGRTKPGSVFCKHCQKDMPGWAMEQVAYPPDASKRIKELESMLASAKVEQHHFERAADNLGEMADSLRKSCEQHRLKWESAVIQRDTLAAECADLRQAVKNAETAYKFEKTRREQIHEELRIVAEQRDQARHFLHLYEMHGPIPSTPRKESDGNS